MSTLSNKFVNFILTIFILALIAYVINLALYVYLPKTNPNVINKDKNTLEYKKYNIKQALEEKKVKQVTTPKKTPKRKNEYQLLSNIKLIAIYDLGEGKGVITITHKGSRDSIILANNEEFKGYVLESVYRDFAVFTKDSKEYRVTMNLKDTPKFTTSSVENNKEEVFKDSIDKNIQNSGDNNIKVNRTYMNSYIKDVSKIWKDISIVEHKVNGKIQGFKVNRLKKKSAFEKLGLQKGDIIKSVNNITLNSYNAVFSLYNKVDKAKAVNMIIIRNNKEMEINYEIE